MNKLTYRPREAQELLGIKHTAFWALVRSGKIETHKIGAATVVKAECLLRFIESLPPAKSCKPQAA